MSFPSDPVEGSGLAPEDLPLLPFFPLLYLVWADGQLSAAEIAQLGKWVEHLGGLDDAGRDRLKRFLDPGSPPSAELLRGLLAAIHGAAAARRPEAPPSLAELGVELARSAPGLGADFATPEIARALAEIEAELGFTGEEGARRLLGRGRPRPRGTLPAEPPLAFEPRDLQALLDAPYGEVRGRVRALLARPSLRQPPAAGRAAYREQVLGWCRELAAEGLGILGHPQEYGGAGARGEFLAAFATLAYGDLSLLVKFGVQFGLFAGAIQELGTDRHHRAFLAAAGSLELPGCFAMSETGHGSNVADLGTVARFDAASGEFVLDTPDRAAAKDWIGNAACHARMAVVFAQLETGGQGYGVHAFLVSIRDAAGAPLPGVRIEDCGEKAGLNGVDNGRLFFTGVRVPRENLLDRFAAVAADGAYSSPIASPARRFFTMLETLVGGRVSVAAAAISAARSALAIAVRYGARRRQFGPAAQPEIPILDYPSHQRRLLPRLAACYAFGFAHQELVERYLSRDEETSRRVEVEAAGLKALCSWLAVDTIQTCRECCGGQGYLAVNRFAALRDDADIFTTFEGDNTVLLQLVAKGLLTQYKSQFDDLDLWGALRFVGRRAATAFEDWNPVVSRRTGEGHLRDPEVHADLFRHREEHLLAEAAGRLRESLRAGADSFAAFNEHQELLLRLARAHVERLAVERFARAAAGAGPTLAPVLENLASLYALSRLEADAGWFLESGHIEGGKARAIRRQIDRLSAELRPHALPLVDAFGIPDECLAPIAFGDPAAG